MMNESGHKLTMYEILVARGKRRMMMESQEDPFDRVERQLREAKRFRVEEYIRSLRPDAPLDEEEQRKRDAFFFGVCGQTKKASLAMADVSGRREPPFKGHDRHPIVPSPRTPSPPASLTSPLSSPPVPSPTSASTPSKLMHGGCLAIPASLANHPSMRMHRMCASSDTPPLASLLQQPMASPSTFPSTAKVAASSIPTSPSQRGTPIHAARSTSSVASPAGNHPIGMTSRGASCQASATANPHRTTILEPSSSSSSSSSSPAPPSRSRTALDVAATGMCN